MKTRSTISLSPSLRQAVDKIKEAILNTQLRVAKISNAESLSLYYGVGEYVANNSRKEFWGSNAINRISEQLHKELPGLHGFSSTSLKKMRQFYEEWHSFMKSTAMAVDFDKDLKGNITESSKSTAMAVDLPINIRQLLPSPTKGGIDMAEFLSISFSHHIEIINKTTNIEERKFYIHATIINSWSKQTLREMLSNRYISHQGKMPNNFPNTISDKRQALKAINMFKDNYLLDFVNMEELGAREIEDIDERVVEQAIIHNIKNFIMTFGKDFAFVGNQYHLDVFSKEHFPDLLFFNRELNSLVCIELKRGEFKTSYLGQLAGYLRILDEKVKKPHENPSIGILLCKDAERDYVEYMIQSYTHPMGVATYSRSSDMPEALRKALPPEEELKKLL